MFVLSIPYLEEDEEEENKTVKTENGCVIYDLQAVTSALCKNRSENMRCEWVN